MLLPNMTPEELVREVDNHPNPSTLEELLAEAVQKLLDAA